MSNLKIRKKAIIDKSKCVACGSCIKVCPLGLISIENGIFAKIDTDRCVCCGKCKKTCPASVIEIKEVV